MFSCLLPELSFIHVFAADVLVVLLGSGHAQELCIRLEKVPQMEVLEAHAILVLEAVAPILYPFVQVESLRRGLDSLYQVRHDREAILRIFGIVVLQEDLFR